jgi:hypothetical protein
MSSSPGSSPVPPAALETDHLCQNGCGNLADTVLVNLTDSSTDIQCHTCLMMMMVAAFRQLAESELAEPAPQVAPTP